MTKLAGAAQRIVAWRKDILLFVHENFGATPDAWQADVLLAYANETDPRKRRIAMKACAGPGKSTVMAWCAWWFLTCCAAKGRHPNGYCTSITGDNLQDALWKELAKWHAVSEFLTAAFEQTTEKIVAKDHPKTWWLKARSWPKSADQETIGRTLSGLHAPFIAYFIDESGDIPTSMLRTAEQGLTNCEWGKIMTGGNTTSQQGLLYEAAVKQAENWFVVSITADPDDPKRTPRVDIGWAREQIKLYGRENPWVMAYILGLFPTASFNALLSSDDIEAAIARRLADDVYSNVQKRIGVDVARFGDDATVLAPRQGKRAFNMVTMRGQRSTAIAARILTAKEKWGSEMELIDDTGGYGSGVIDQCLLANLALVPVNFAGAATDPRYFNLRSEMLWKAAEWVKNGGQLPDMPVLVREGSAATYYLDNGRIRVEEKAQIKKRLGYSPDHWDALAVTFAIPDQPASIDSLLAAIGHGSATGEFAHAHAASEWDPYNDSRN